MCYFFPIRTIPSLKQKQTTLSKSVYAASDTLNWFHFTKKENFKHQITDQTSCDPDMSCVWHLDRITGSNKHIALRSSPVQLGNINSKCHYRKFTSDFSTTRQILFILSVNKDHSKSRERLPFPPSNPIAYHAVRPLFEPAEGQGADFHQQWGQVRGGQAGFYDDVVKGPLTEAQRVHNPPPDTNSSPTLSLT